MNERKRIEIAEMKLQLYYEQGGWCAACGKPVGTDDGELAHRIPQRRWALAKYGPRIIHHHDNLALTHPGACNDAMSISNQPVECERLAKSIADKMLGVGGEA